MTKYKGGMNNPLEIMKALSDRNRLRVAAALMTQNELCACNIIELLQVTGATASRHMDVLLRAGLVKSRKAGRWVHYRLNRSAAAPLFQWLETELQNDLDIKADRKTLVKITGCKK
ncbi:MAG: metalloregulator ArsR/SmtB family transcription factor [Kiritimatiellales bacterium]|nr:metalloregulator ArsR/SmtB family transcription factor [Kiritimatiellales bacterium]